MNQLQFKFNESRKKKCSKCNEFKDLTEFHKNKTTSTGFSSNCKSCQKKYTKKYYEENKEKYKENTKKWREENKEYNKKYYEKNKEKYKEHNKKYYEENKEYYKKWREENKEYYKKYHEENKERIREYQKNRLKTDSLFKLSSTLRSRTYSAFKAKRWLKNSSNIKMLGCDLQTANEHIEKQFKGGMTWDNHGDWHIDHIIPLASANTKEELMKLCHYTNLQPLWAEENLSKSDKF